MATVTPSSRSDQGGHEPDKRPDVIKSILTAAAGCGGAVGSLLAIGGQVAANDSTVRLAIGVTASLFALAMFVIAFAIWPRR
jgi:hypothetical protein